MKSSHVLTRRPVSFVLRLFWLLALALLVLELVGTAQASTNIIVNSFEDIKKSNDGLCTLREAVIAANSDKPSGRKPGECRAGNGADIIVLRLEQPGTYILTRTDSGKEDASQTGDLDITDDLTIRVEDLTGEFFGATIAAADVVNDRVIHVVSGNVSISGVTITGGNVPGDGGGIYSEGNLALTNVTVSGNAASGSGGGIYNAGTLTLNNVTVANNTAVVDGGGIVNQGVSVEFQNTIVASNDPADCLGPLSSQDHNLDSDGTCVTDGVNGDITSVTPLLGPLQDNGGGPLTHALLPGSPAIDAGNDGTCEVIDERGVLRPQRAACDIGAYEAVNNAPVADDDTDTTDEDVAVTIDVLGNDTDLDGDSLFVDSVTQPANGVAVNNGGDVTYTPDDDFNGEDVFTYIVSDNFGGSDLATVYITVFPVDDPPNAVDDSVTTPEDTSVLINAAANDSDPDGNLDPSTAIVLSGSSYGTLGNNGDGTFNYTPNLNYNGPDSFTYEICDTDELCDTATVNIDVTPVNDAPVANDDTASTVEDVPVTIPVLANDSDVDGDSLKVTGISGPSNGTVVINDDGTVAYTPDPNFDGMDSFSYQASDGELSSDTATVTIVVEPDGYIEVTNTNHDGPGSLRAAIEEANLDTDLDTIVFEIPGDGPHTIWPTSALPPVIHPVIIDGTTQPGVQPSVILDGSIAGLDVDGLTITAGDSTVLGLEIVNFDGNGILLDVEGDNRIEGNTIAGNGGDGIRVGSGSTGNTIRDNDIYDNGGLPIDLGDDGSTPNDPGDGDVGGNYVQNYPVLFRAVPNPSESSLIIEGRLNSTPNTEFTLDFYASASCSASGSGSQIFLEPDDPVSVETSEAGDVYFKTTLDSAVEAGWFILATATDPNGNTSEFSPCVLVGPDNDSWPRALRLALTGDPPSALYDQYIDQFGQSRWYKFEVQPNSTVIVELTNLSANYDLTFYKDIAAAYEELTTLGTQDDLLHLSAQFAPAAFSPAAFSPAAFSPAAFSPAAFSPAAFSPAAFSPAAFSPAAFSPAAFSPAAFSPAAFSPAAFSPAAFSPAAFSPAAFSPAAFSPAAFSPAAFSSAQAQSLIGVSAFEGTASEGLVLETWNNTGDFYIRVRGREGAFSLAAPFHLKVTQILGPCSNDGSIVTTVLEEIPSTIIPTDGDYKTIILTDLGRMAGSEDLGAKLDEFADPLNHPEVAGVVVDVGTDARVAWANDQADTFLECPYAKNVVADEIKNIIDGYREENQDTLEYIVIVGNDDVIPFYRYPDNALLGHESNYVPPVFDNTASQASLRLGYVLSQDGYGASVDFSLNANEFPIPELAVGRLVETPAEVITLLDAYLLHTDDGVVPTPESALVTGYDFLEDAAVAIQAELEAGIDANADTLITPANVSPQDPASWTADDLAAFLLNNRYDLAFLAGHFSASGALAADYTTALFTTDLIASPVDMTNAIIYSAGCHSGYNIVNDHSIPGVTLEPDWAQAFAQKGATLIAGTGYQYGDTDFIEYSERLYLEFTRQLRTGSGPVSIGQALVAAKQAYLASTPTLRGIHEKALLEATIFGLPMLSVNMPGERIIPDDDASIVGTTTPFMVNPGWALRLRYFDFTLVPTLETHTVDLKNVDDDTIETAQYLSGGDGVLVNPVEPALPLEVENVTVPDMVLRGVGFRGGAYTDDPNVLPLIGAATTEIRGVHSPFLSDVFWPIRPWNINYFDALVDPDNGTTFFAVTPAQHVSSAPGSLYSTLRQFDSMDFRLYYSNNIDTDSTSVEDSTPALADAPTIVYVSGTPRDGFVDFEIRVVGNPAAGVQEVWVTWTDTSNPATTSDPGTWQSVDLVQNGDDSTLWEGALPLNGMIPGKIRFIVQAVNGVGVTALATNQGAYYTPGVEVGLRQPTNLTLDVDNLSSGPFGSQAAFSAVLTNNNGEPLSGKVIYFGLGAERRQGVTDDDGRATVEIPLIGRPGQYTVRASFAGTAEYVYSTDTGEFEITRQATLLSLTPETAYGRPTDESLMVATLEDAAGRRLIGQTIFFIVTDEWGTYREVVGVTTDYIGRAVLGNLSVPAGTYSVEAYFNFTIPLGDDKSTTLSDEHYLPSSATGQLILDLPLCQPATVSPHSIWSPRKDLISLSVHLTDISGSSIPISITAIYQDEPVGKKKSFPDGWITGLDTVDLRAERDGRGDGRVYHIEFIEQFGFCEGEVRVAVVPHDNSDDVDIDAIDSGPPYYDSRTGEIYEPMY